MEIMNEKIDFIFTTKKTDLYKQAIKLRYEVFFRPLNVSLDAVYDSLEDMSIHLVAKTNDAILGYGRLTIENDEGQISQMVVEKDYRGIGLGAEIVRILIEKAAENGVARIFLNARIDALEFYEKLGFISIGTDFPSKKTGIPHKRMEKAINK